MRAFVWYMSTIFISGILVGMMGCTPTSIPPCAKCNDDKECDALYKNQGFYQCIKRGKNNEGRCELRSDSNPKVSAYTCPGNDGKKGDKGDKGDPGNACKIRSQNPAQKDGKKGTEITFECEGKAKPPLFIPHGSKGEAGKPCTTGKDEPIIQGNKEVGRKVTITCGTKTETVNLMHGDTHFEKKEADKLKKLLEHMELKTINGKLTLLIQGVNVQIVNGLGDTNKKTGTQTKNGLGNLLIGYNGARTDSKATNRTGSHNLVVGDGHSFSSHGGTVLGRDNTVSGAFASVTGGTKNAATAANTSISGGEKNTASGAAASISGGSEGRAIGKNASISGGQQNFAYADNSSISGGFKNRTGAKPSSKLCATNADCPTSKDCYIASTRIPKGTTKGQCMQKVRGTGSEYLRSSVSGGHENHAIGAYSAISGGAGNRAYGEASSITGGLRNRTGMKLKGACSSTCVDCYFKYPTNNTTKDLCLVEVKSSGAHASVSGGVNNFANGSRSSVSGGEGNFASGHTSSIQGGHLNSTGLDSTALLSSTSNIGRLSSISGGLFNANYGYYSTILGGGQ